MNFANCADFNLPVIKFDGCNPEVNYSEIETIFIGGPKAAPFANIADKNEWGTRMSQNTIGPNAVRALTVIADMPAAAAVVKELSNGRRKQIGKDFTVNYTADDISDENYAFFAVLDEQPIVRLFGFQTQGGKMYHYGDDGILVNHNSNGVLARGRDEIEVENGVFTWRSKKRPTRIDSPVYEGDNGGSGTPTSFDSGLHFDAVVTDTTEGVTGTTDAADAELTFEFNAITPRVGTPASMTINKSSVSELVVDFTSDYMGSAFRFTAKNGNVHIGNFISGTVNF